MPELLGIPLSPWTEKARFALDHHRVAYDYAVYTPMLGEAALRLRTRKLTGRVSVPVLFDGGRAIPDSFAIAKHADAIGAGEPLVEGAGKADVVAWNDRSETALDAARTLSLPRLVSTPGAAEEALPKFVPSGARPAMAKVAELGIAYVGWKYGASANEGGALSTIEATLVALREALGGRPYLLEKFGYADVAMAAVMQFLRPVEHASVRIGRATREAMTNADLAAKYADLLDWRDAIYANHRVARA